MNALMKLFTPWRKGRAQASLAKQASRDSQFAEMTGSGTQIITTTQDMGTPIDELRYTQQGLALPVFLRATKFLADSIAMMPRKVYQRDGFAREQADHPVRETLRRPNRIIGGMQFFSGAMMQAQLHGNSYSLITRDRPGATPQLWQLDHDRLIPILIYPDGKPELVYVTRGDKTPAVFAASDVLHIRSLHVNGLVGIPTADYMSQTLTYSRDVRKFGDNVLRRGGSAGTALVNEKNFPPDYMTKFQSDLENRAAGFANAGRWLAVSDGWKPVTIALQPAQVQLIESLGANELDICRIIGVPQHIVFNFKDLKWSNAEQAALDVLQNSLQPWVVQIEEELTNKLLTAEEIARGLFIRLSIDGLLRADAKTRVEVARLRLDAGMINLDEMRAIEDMPPLPDGLGQTFRVPANCISAQRLRDGTPTSAQTPQSQIENQP